MSASLKALPGKQLTRGVRQKGVTGQSQRKATLGSRQGESACSCVHAFFNKHQEEAPSEPPMG